MYFYAELSRHWKTEKYMPVVQLYASFFKYSVYCSILAVLHYSQKNKTGPLIF